MEEWEEKVKKDQPTPVNRTAFSNVRRMKRERLRPHVCSVTEGQAQWLAKENKNLKERNKQLRASLLEYQMKEVEDEETRVRAVNLSIEVEEKTSSIGQLETVLNEKNNEISFLRDKINSAEKELDSTSAKLRRSIDRMKMCEHIPRTPDRSRDLSAIIGDLKAQAYAIHDLANEFIDTKKALADTRTSNKDLKIGIKELKFKLNLKEKEIKDLDTKYQELQYSFEDLKDLKGEVDKELKRERKNLKETNKSNEEFDERNKNLGAENLRLYEQIEELEIHIRNQDDKIDKLNKANGRLEEQKADLFKCGNDSDRENRKLKEQHNKMVEKLRNMRETNRKLSDGNAELSRALSLLQDQVIDLSIQIDEEQLNDIQKLKSIIGQMEKQMEKKDAELTELKIAFKDAGDSIMKQQSQISELEEKIKQDAKLLAQHYA